MRVQVYHQYIMVAKTCMVDLLKVKAITDNGEGLEVEYLNDPEKTFIPCPNPDRALAEAFAVAQEKATILINDGL